MPSSSFVSYTLPPAERAEGARGAAALRGAAQVELRLVRGDGTEQAVVLPPGAVPAVADLLDRLARSEAVAVLAAETEVSPEEAARLLGISRPLVRRRMDAGVLPFRRVGAHRRLRLADVLALRARETPVRAAIEALAADTEDLEQAHGL
jgi:excisionase family DNA binding protein